MQELLHRVIGSAEEHCAHQHSTTTHHHGLKRSFCPDCGSLNLERTGPGQTGELFRQPRSQPAPTA